MFPGGISDKQGNAFEDSWTARQLLNLFESQDGNILFEPVQPGYEFTLELNSKTAWHQVKMKRTGRAWSIKDLISNGFLDNAKARLEATLEDECLFITDADCFSLGRLVAAADMSTDPRDFAARANQADSGNLKELCKAWKLDKRATLILLTRIGVHRVSEAELESALANSVRMGFSSPPSEVMNSLLTFGRKHLGKTISCQEIRDYLLVEHGYQRRSLEGDKSLVESLRQATKLYTSSVDERRPGFLIPRPEITSVTQEWLNAPDARLLLIEGAAGTGKSIVTRQVVEGLEQSGVQVLALRIDHHLDTQSQTNLGESTLGRSIELAIASRAVSSENQRCAIVIDQLDAVSDASGRRGQAKRIISQLIDDVLQHSSVRVVLVCRSFDLDNDQRLASYRDHKGSHGLTLTPFNWETDVAPVLIQRGYDVSGLTARQIQILTLARNLKLWIDLYDQAGEPPTFSDWVALVVQTIQMADVRAKDAGETWSALEVLSDVADAMNEAQLLTAHSSVLDNHRNAQKILKSCGLIQGDNAKIQFGHESYFDLIFARRFVSGSQCFKDWLLEDQQPFRRTQVRQILETLRSEVGSTSKRYLKALEVVWLGPEVRIFIKHAVASWLAEIDAPTTREWLIVFPEGTTTISSAAFRVLRSPAWASMALEKLPLYSHMIGTCSDQKDRALVTVARASKQASNKRVQILIDLLKSGSPTSVSDVTRALWMIEAGPDTDQILRLAKMVIRQTPLEELNLEEGGLELLRRKSSMTASHQLEIFGVYLDHFFHIQGPRQSTKRRRRYNGLSNRLAAIVRAEPGLFLDTIAPLYLEHVLATKDAEAKVDGFATNPERLNEETDWPGIIHLALRRAAQTDNGALARFRNRLRPDTSRIHLYYLTLAISMNGWEGAQDFTHIINSEYLFRLTTSSPWRIGALAALAVRPALALNDWKRFEARTFDHSPEHSRASSILSTLREDPETTWVHHDQAVHAMTLNGLARSRIVNFIGPSNFSVEYQSEIRVLDRKFTDKAIPTFRSGVGHVVSPIAEDATQKMTDDQWLKAIARYSDDDPREHTFLEDRFIGGARQVAAQLGTRTKDDPVRFADFVGRLSVKDHSQYIAAILLGIVDSSAPLSTCLVTFEAYSKVTDSFDFEFLRLVRSRPESAKTAWVFEKLVEFARSGPMISDGTEPLFAELSADTIS